MTMNDRLTGRGRLTPCTVALLAVCLVLCASLGGCKSPRGYRIEADRVAADIIKEYQKIALRRTVETFTIETPANTLRRRLLVAQGLPVLGRASMGTDLLTLVPHWPEGERPPRAKAIRPVVTADEDEVRITLMQALQIAARNNRAYQTAKEGVFVAALDLDLESREFRNTFAGLLSGTITHDGSSGRPVSGVTGSAEPQWSRRFKSGAALTGRIGVDLVKLLTRGRDSSRGIFADTSITVPLLRGAGRHIVTEPLTQAQRNVIYAIYTLQRHKRTLAVQVATDYLAVLQQDDRIDTAKANRASLTEVYRIEHEGVLAGRRAQADEDQAYQNKLRADDRVPSAEKAYERQLDTLKLTLGLPTDARVDVVRKAPASQPVDPKLKPVRSELAQMLDREMSAAAARTTEGKKARDAGKDEATVEAIESKKPGRFELRERDAVKLALAWRLDLRTARARVVDAQRGVVVAADGLKADVTLTGSASTGARRSVGSAAARNAQLRPEEGVYTAAVTSDLPWERTAERNAYRASYISLERATRNVQELEDAIKLSVRGALRTLELARERFDIQYRAVKLAERRKANEEMRRAADRAKIRDLLEAEEAWLSVKNQLTAAVVDYRIAELELQRDMGALKVDEKGLWREYRPGQEE